MGHIITMLMVALLITAFFQPNTPRMLAAIIFSVITILHDLLFSRYDGLAYYGTAALADLLIAILISGISPTTKTASRLIDVCGVSIVFGMLWYFYPFDLPNLFYEGVYVGIYTCALIILIKKNGADDLGSNGAGCRFFRIPVNFSSFYRNKDQG